MSKRRKDLVIFIQKDKFKMMKFMQKTIVLIRRDAMN